MSKKKFSEGLDDLFKDMTEFDELRGLDAAAATPVAETTRRSGGKSFADNLDAILQDALDESLRKSESSQPGAALSGKSKSAESAHMPAPSGLDALIRQTIDIKEITQDEESGKKRLVVAVDRTKLEKLKTIARLENSFMKDLLVHLIDDFIEEYKQSKGLDL